MDAVSTATHPDAGEIRRGLDLLHPSGVVELRALFQRGRKRTAAGYFDPEHRGDLVDAAVKLNADGAAVYVNLNPLDAQLLSRYSNRTEDYAQSTATDANVTGRRWLLIDLDPTRPKDTSATAEQLEAAKATGRTIYAWLQARGWPKPIVAESGNGLHLLYRIDLPNDDATRDLVKAVLETLAQRFDDAAVKVDKSVFNAARIVKLYGATANKGDSTPAAPWRVSRIVQVPDELQAVPVEMLQALASEGEKAERPRTNGAPHDGARAWTEADVETFLGRAGLEVVGEPGLHDGAMRWKLKACPFNDAHGRGEAAVFMAADGRLGFRCQHSSCADRHWRDLRELVDGPREGRQEVPGCRTSRTVAAGATPLMRPIPPPEPYPVEALGPVLAPAARALAELVQVPDALAAGCVLAAAALVTQKQANVQTLGGARPLALFVLTIAGSGDRKTAADKVALSPVDEHVRKMHATYEAELAEWERAKEASKLDRSNARKAAGSGDEYAEALREIAAEPKPRKPWIVSSEPTAEGLVKSLADGQYAQGIFTDEGGQFLGGHALTEEAELRTIALLSRLWQGDRIDRVRATDSEHVVLYGRRLSMHLLVQPDVATRMLGKPLYRSQGFLARWLMAGPDSLAGTRLHDPTRSQPDDDPRVRRFWHALGELLAAPANEDREVGGLDPPCLALTPAARSLLVEAYDEIERAQARDGVLEGVREWASKAAEHACRLAGVLTLVADPMALAVTGETMAGALALTQFYLSEYMRLVGSADVPENIRHAQELLTWLRQKKRATVTARDVMRLGPGRAIRHGDAAKAALRTLAEHGWLATEDGKVYVVNQAALSEES